MMADSRGVKVPSFSLRTVVFAVTLNDRLYEQGWQTGNMAVTAAKKLFPRRI